MTSKATKVVVVAIKSAVDDLLLRESLGLLIIFQSLSSLKSSND
jgi:hypothetical protein